MKQHSCKQCHKLFTHRTGNTVKGLNTYCSRKCQGISRTENGIISGKNNGNWITGAERSKKCEACKKTFHWKDIYAKNGQHIPITVFHKRKFCSPDCRKTGKKYQRQSEHWNWRGGITGWRQSIMSSGKYRNWRKEVFQRDNYTCQGCGQRGGWLEADHILSASENREKIFDLDNGRTLCRPCHKKTFKFMGNQYRPHYKSKRNGESLEQVTPC